MQSLGRKMLCFEICYLLVLQLTFFSSEQMPVISTVSAMAVWTALTILQSELPLILTSLKWIPVMTDPAQVPGLLSVCLCSPSIISPPLRSRHNRTCLSLFQTHQKSLGESLFFTVGVKRHLCLVFFSLFQSFLFFHAHISITHLV